MAGWLLKVGLASEVAAEGDEAGEGIGAVVCGVSVDMLAGVADGVVAGVGVFVGDDSGVALNRGVGELADWPPDGSADFCSHAMTRRLAKAMGRVKSVFTPINTDA